MFFLYSSARVKNFQSLFISKVFKPRSHFGCCFISYPVKISQNESVCKKTTNGGIYIHVWLENQTWTVVILRIFDVTAVYCAFNFLWTLRLKNIHLIHSLHYLLLLMIIAQSRCVTHIKFTIYIYQNRALKSYVMQVKILHDFLFLFCFYTGGIWS